MLTLIPTPEPTVDGPPTTPEPWRVFADENARLKNALADAISRFRSISALRHPSEPERLFIRIADAGARDAIRALESIV